MCTDAYREALTRHLSSRAPATPAPHQHRAAEGGREDVAAAGAAAGSGPAMALAKGAAVVNGKAIDQR
jgi:hypothetical protein